MHGLGDPRLGLVWKTEQDIGIHTFDATLADHRDGVTRDIETLDATDGVLDVRVEVLNTDRGACHPLAGERVQAWFVKLVGIDLYRKLGALGHWHNFGNRLGQFLDHIGGHQGGCAAAPMHTTERDTTWKVIFQKGNFVFQVVQIAAHGCIGLSALCSAGAEPAQVTAKRNVQIQRDPAVFRNRMHPFLKYPVLHHIRKMWRRGVACVTWYTCVE